MSPSDNSFSRYRVGACAVALVLAVVAISPAAASSQSPAAVDQYRPSPPPSVQGPDGNQGGPGDPGNGRGGGPGTGVPGGTDLEARSRHPQQRRSRRRGGSENAGSSQYLPRRPDPHTEAGRRSSVIRSPPRCAPRSSSSCWALVAAFALAGWRRYTSGACHLKRQLTDVRATFLHRNEARSLAGCLLAVLLLLVPTAHAARPIKLGFGDPAFAGQGRDAGAGSEHPRQRAGRPAGDQLVCGRAAAAGKPGEPRRPGLSLRRR